MKKLFNDGWLFMANAQGDVPSPDYACAGFEKVDLPHDYQITRPRSYKFAASQGFFPRGDILWYVKKFTASNAARTELLFDGAQRFATVYLNGREICAHKYGYTQFSCDLTKYILRGAVNTLCVRLDDTDAGDRWYSGMGIYRNVWLRETPEVRVAPWSLRARYSFDGNDVVANVEAEILGAVRPEEAVFTLAGETAKVSGTGTVTAKIRVKNAKRWDIETPVTYELTCAVAGETERVNVGFREAVFDADKGFFLNGRSLKLIGADLHHDGGSLGAAVPLGFWYRRLKKLKSLGINAIRCSHNPQAAEFYDLCDELGLLVIDELYDKWDGTELYFKDIFPTERRGDLKAMVARDFNHPSIILWSVGNEVEIQYSEKYYEYLKELCALCRELDPSRGVSMALISYVLKDFNEETPIETRLAATLRYGEIVDVFMGNYMEQFYEALRARGLKKAFIGSEVLSYYRFEEMSNTNLVNRSAWMDVYAHDWVAGGFVWAGIDYLGESTGWPSRGWTACPIDSAGFLKIRAHHLKSQWTREPMIKIGVIDHSVKWDMANGMWGFPPMTGDWNLPDKGRVYEVRVMTNCEEARLSVNGRAPRTAKIDENDRMAHFWVNYAPGELRAEGLIAGKAACEDVIKTSKAPARLELAAFETPAEARRFGLLHIEAQLVDERDQPYTRMNPMLEFSVSGPAVLLKAMSGDFMTDDDGRFTCDGHMLYILKLTGETGVVTVRARAGLLRESMLQFDVGGK